MSPSSAGATAHRPRAVRTACALMLCGALAQAVNTAASAVDRDGIRSRTAQLASQYKGRALHGTELERATDQAYWFTIGTGVIFVLLWLFVARLCQGRHPVGRIMATVLTIVYTFTFLVSGFASIGPGTVLGLVLATTGIAVVYFLWRPAVGAWLAARPPGSGLGRR